MKELLIKASFCTETETETTEDTPPFSSLTLFLLLLLQANRLRSAPPSPDRIRLAVGSGPPPVFHVVGGRQVNFLLPYSFRPSSLSVQFV